MCAQSDGDAAGQHLREAHATRGRWAGAAEVVAAAEEDVLAYIAFPQDHRMLIYSTNPLGRLNEVVKRQTNVMAVFPDLASMIRLVGSVLLMIWGKWEVVRRHSSLEPMRTLSVPEPLPVAEPQA